MNGFADSCRGESNSLTLNYMRYVWTQFTHEHESPEVDRKEYMNNVGAVSRGVNNILVNPLLNDINYRSGALMLNWKFYGEGAAFEIRVYDAPKEGSVLLDTIFSGMRFPAAFRPLMDSIGITAAVVFCARMLVCCDNPN